jgi:hypothetical protein
VTRRLMDTDLVTSPGHPFDRADRAGDVSACGVEPSDDEGGGTRTHDLGSKRVPGLLWSHLALRRTFG